jgi:predicted ATP-grasp superfamily ATP-dependent carboligase
MLVSQAIGHADPAALVLGLDSHGLAVARALSRAGVAVYAVEKDRQNPGIRTRYVKRVFPVADYTAEHLMPALALARRALAAHGKVALLAINDRQVEVIAQHLPALRVDYCIAWADQAESIVKLQRKDQLESVAVKQGLNYPKSVVFVQPDWPADAPTLRYPVILKPVRPLSSFKALLIDEPVDLIPALQRQAHDLPILAQEYILGGDAAIYFGALLLDRGRVVHGMAGRKIASYPPARGQTTIAETVDAPDVMRLTRQFFDGFALSGPVSLELKLDTEGRFWVIEPTIGRTDFWVELCINAGFNQPLMEFELAVGLPLTDPGPLRGSVWYDTERDIAAYAGLCWREAHLRPRGKSQAFPYLRHRDWHPFVGAVVRLIRRWARPHAPEARNPLPEFVASKPYQPPSK